MKNIESFIRDLKFQNGIWLASETQNISYPSDGNNTCYAIEDNSFWFNNRNKIIYEVVKNYSINGPLFDVGGGNGFVSSYLDKNGFETVLVEPGIDGCVNGRNRGLQNIINSNFDTMHFYPNSIPNIGIFDVLEHVEKQDQFLKTLHTSMLTNGILFITVPAFKKLWSEEDNQAGHFRRYRTQDLRKIVETSGFEILYSSYFFSFLVIPIFLFRTIPSKIGTYKISSQQTKNQHLSKSGSNKLSDVLMKFDLKKIKRGKSILFGSSIILAARKI